MIGSARISNGQSFKFTSLDHEPGLQGKGVVSLLQDRDGFLWVGTTSGLARYDGVEFDVFLHSELDSTSITDNFLSFNSLLEDPQGNIWAGTRYGLSRWSRLSESFTQFYANDDSTGLRSDEIKAVHVARSGIVWISLVDNGVTRYDPDADSFEHFRHDPENQYSLWSNTVTGITEDISGTIWASNRFGLTRYNADLHRFERVDLPPELASNPDITTIHAGIDNYLWVGTMYQGLVRYEIQSGEALVIPVDGKLPSVSTLYQEASGTLWVGSYSDGLYRVDSGSEADVYLHRVSSFLHTSPEDLITDIIMDRTGVLWVASWSGLKKGVPPMFTEYTQSTSGDQVFDLSMVQTLFEDHNGDLWGGLRDGGVIKYDAVSKQVMNLSSGPGLEAITHGVYSISRDHEGYLWFATAGGGAYRYDETTGGIQHYQHDAVNDSTLSSNSVYTIFEDANNQVWVGTADGGINTLDRETNNFTRIMASENDPQSLSHDSVWPILEDSKGRVWLGTFGGGLNLMLDPDGRFKHYRAQDPSESAISNNRVVALMEAADGALWISTMGGGANRFDPETETFENWSVEDGFPSENVVCILEDEHNILWMGTDTGLVRFVPETGEFRSYNEHHGLSSASFAYNGCLKAQDGTLYFGTGSGMISFKPEDIKDGNPPISVITELEVFDEPVPVERTSEEVDTIRLKHNENFLDIHFAALDFKAPEMNQFSFFLDGYDRDWSRPSTQPFTRYTGLDPGTYTFFVRAADGYGAWTAEAAALRVRVNPPYWKSWWFVSSILMVIVLGVLGISKNRMDRKREIANTKKRIANDLHDDLGSRLAALGLRLDSTAKLKDPEKLSARIQGLAARTREIIQDMRDITRLVEDEGQGSISDIIEALQKQARDLLPEHIEIHEDFPDRIPEYHVTMLWQHNILLVFSETLSNISRHAEASMVNVKTWIEEEQFVMRVIDDGVGFDTRSYVAGKGIISIENRAKRLNGSLVYQSTPGKGTIVELRAPIKNGK